jgi:replication factor C subunit 2/4
MSAPGESTTKTPQKSGYDVPWVERYRPETLEDVVGNEDTIVRLRAIAKDGNMPNLILCGPPGTGKVNST